MTNNVVEKTFIDLCITTCMTVEEKIEYLKNLQQMLDNKSE